MHKQNEKLSNRSYIEEVRKLEQIKNDISLFKEEKIDENLVTEVYTGEYGIANIEKPILKTTGIYTCVSFFAYDPNKNYTFLAHSFGNMSFGVDNDLPPSQFYEGNFHKAPFKVQKYSSVHVIEMLSTLSKKELYQL